MSFIKELRSYFFRGNAPINPNVPEDHKDNMAKEGVPSQDTMERFTASHLNFRETEDRAKQSTGAELDRDLVGHSQVETDVLAKAWTDGLQAETTKIVHAQQLPDVNSDNQTTTPLDGVDGDIINAPSADIESITSTIDPTELRRNNFLLRISAAFQGYLNSLVNNLSFINTFVMGTGGRGAPGQDGTGLSGLIYGTDGTPGAPGDDGLLVHIYGPTGDPSDVGCPSVMCTLYGEDGLPGDPGDNGLNALIPVGVMQMYPSSTPPTGWVNCAGQTLDSVTNTQYAKLYTIIGVTYGGTGPTDFKLPDMRAQFPLGYNNDAGLGADRPINGMGVTGGTIKNNLDETQLPAHQHILTNGTANVASTTTTTGDHRHALVTAEGTGSGECEKGFNIGGADGTHHRYTSPGTSNGNDNNAAGCTGATLDGGHNHTIGSTISGQTDSSPAWTSADIENRPAYMVINYIIKAEPSS